MLLHGSRQYMLQAYEANLHVPLREEHGADEQEHYATQGHLRASKEKPTSGETTVSYTGECGLCIY